MVGILKIGGNFFFTGRDLGRIGARQTDFSGFVRKKRRHVDRPPGMAVSDARCRNYPRTVASEELGLTVGTVNLRVSLPQAISRSACQRSLQTSQQWSKCPSHSNLCKSAFFFQP